MNEHNNNSRKERDQAEQNAADGLERSAAKRGCFIPHVTPITISMGIMQSRKVEIQPENLGKSKSDMKPSEMAMTSAVARMPRIGCLRPDKDVSFRAAHQFQATAMLLSRQSYYHNLPA